MSLRVFPTKNNPQFYLSNNDNVITFFIHNYLFSGKSEIQLLINLFMRILPDRFTLFLLKILLGKENHLPHGLSEKIAHIKEFIKKNSNVFLLNSVTIEDINFIIRKNAWQRKDDKFVVILFTVGNTQPFAVAKAGTLRHKESIELEYENTKIIFDRLKNSETFVIPKPLAFYVSYNVAVYFEKVIEGTPLNNYLKLKFSKASKHSCYLYVLNRCKDLLIGLGRNKETLSSGQLLKYIYEPIDYVRKTDLGNKYPSRLNELKEQADGIKDKLYSVYMHGDLWGGSILYNNGKIGVIDWEFLTTTGVPMWDFFSIVFHIGVGINKGMLASLSDFMNYFTDTKVSGKVDRIIEELTRFLQIDTKHLPFLLQSYLLFNIKNRDTESERYWQDCLEYYWRISDTKAVGIRRLL